MPFSMSLLTFWSSVTLSAHNDNNNNNDNTAKRGDNVSFKDIESYTNNKTINVK